MRTSLLVFHALEESCICSVVPDGRRGLAFLAQRIHRRDPVARGAAARVMFEGGCLDWLLGEADDVPGTFELVDAIARNLLFRIRGPFQVGSTLRFVIEERVRFRRNGERVR